MCKASLIFSWKDVEAVSRIEKQSSEHKDLHSSDPLMCWKICEFLSDVKCSRTRHSQLFFFFFFFFFLRRNHLPYWDHLWYNLRIICSPWINWGPGSDARLYRFQRIWYKLSGSLFPGGHVCLFIDDPITFLHLQSHSKISNFNYIYLVVLCRIFLIWAGAPFIPEASGLYICLFK